MRKLLGLLLALGGGHDLDLSERPLLTLGGLAFVEDAIAEVEVCAVVELRLRI